MREYEKNINPSIKSNSNLVEYEKVLTENIEYIDKFIKELHQNINNKFIKKSENQKKNFFNFSSNLLNLMKTLYWKLYK